MPFATAGQKPLFLDSAASLQALTNSTWNPRETVFLPLEAQNRLHATNKTEARVLSSSYKIHRQEYKTLSKEASLLVISQAHYAPWKAYVNGKSVPIWKANHAFQAVEIPAGTSVVKLAYEDPLFRLGAIISLGTLLLCTFFGLRGRLSLN
jgi:uncharacterized membrane protein YfhO